MFAGYLAARFLIAFLWVAFAMIVLLFALFFFALRAIFRALAYRLSQSPDIPSPSGPRRPKSPRMYYSNRR